MDRRESDARVGKMCVRVAAAGNSGISRLPVWVDFMVLLLGNTCIPTGSGSMLIKGTSQCR